MPRLVCVLLLLSLAPSVEGQYPTWMNLRYKLQCGLHHGFSYFLNMIEKDIAIDDRVGYFLKHSDYPVAEGTVSGYDTDDGPWNWYLEFGLKWGHNCTSDGSWRDEREIYLGTCKIGTTRESVLTRTIGV